MPVSSIDTETITLEFEGQPAQQSSAERPDRGNYEKLQDPPSYPVTFEMPTFDTALPVPVSHAITQPPQGNHSIRNKLLLLVAILLILIIVSVIVLKQFG